MRKVVFFITITLVIFSINVKAQQDYLYQPEQINNFQTHYVINKDGTVDVTEIIEYQFPERRHGILRNIPYKKTNEDGKKYVVGITVNGVADKNGVPYSYTTSKDSQYIKLKIGDADKYVGGIQTYQIKYKVSGALTYFTDHDEFYWNVTGNGWDYPIIKSSAQISLDGTQPVSQNDLEAICFTGSSGSKEQKCKATVSNNGAVVLSDRTFEAREGLTVAFKFPKNVVAVLEAKLDQSWILLMIVTIIGAVIGLFWYVFLPLKIFLAYWKDKTNTKKKQRVVSAWFEPPSDKYGKKLTPAETSSMVSKSIGNKEVTSIIVDLAQRGYLKIKQIETKGLFGPKKDLQLIKLKPFEGLNSFESKLVEAIFDEKEEIKIADLKDKTSVYNGIAKVKSMVTHSLVSKELFKKDPGIVATTNIVIGVLGFMLFNPILSAVAILFGRKSAPRTDVGIEKYSEAVSLRNYLVSQDEKLDFMADKQMFFEKLLPYATAFGVEDVWIKKFGDLALQNPEWYEGDTGSLAALSTMTHSLSSGVSAMSTTRSSTGHSSGFSGGGSSGGGGGGGGGGSW